MPGNTIKPKSTCNPDNIQVKFLPTTNKKCNATLVDFLYENFFNHGMEPVSTLLTDQPGQHPFNKIINEMITRDYTPGETVDDSKLCCVLYDNGGLGPDTSTYADNNFEPEFSKIAAYIDGAINTPEYFIKASKEDQDPSLGQLYEKVGNSVWKLIKMTFAEIKSAITNNKKIGDFKSNSEIFIEVCMKMGQDQLLEKLKASGAEKILYIKQQSTSVDHQRQGFGSQISQAFLDEATRKRGVSHAIVEATGLGTCKIYKKLGFEEVGFHDYKESLGKWFVDNEVNRKVAETHKGCTLFYKKILTRVDI